MVHLAKCPYCAAVLAFKAGTNDYGGLILEETPETGPNVAGVFYSLNSAAQKPCEYLIRVSGRFLSETEELVGMVAWEHPLFAAYAARKLSRWVQHGEEFELPTEVIDEAIGKADAEGLQLVESNGAPAERSSFRGFNCAATEGRMSGHCLFASDPDTFVSDAIARCDKYATADHDSAGVSGFAPFADASDRK